MSSSLQLNCTTAPGHTFSSRQELSAHYKSHWHQHNVKRREAGLLMLPSVEYQAQLEAARLVRLEQDVPKKRDHIKGNKREMYNDKNRRKHEEPNELAKSRHRRVRRITRLEHEPEEGGLIRMPSRVHDSSMEHTGLEPKETQNQQQLLTEEQDAPPIDPCQSLFDKRVFPTVQANVQYMYDKYGFFIPNSEYCTDQEGLIGYCAEKVKLGHYCLYCEKTFQTYQGCQNHMVITRHTMLRYEETSNKGEFEVFYDFPTVTEEGTPVENEFVDQCIETNSILDDQCIETNGILDVDSEEEEYLHDNHNDTYASYVDNVRTQGFDITPAGEMVLPDGRTIGHRGLARFYKQRLVSYTNNKVAVLEARRAAGERLVRGRVYDTHAIELYNSKASCKDSPWTMAMSDLVPGSLSGRQGRGILVPVEDGTGRKVFTALSLYRFKATILKSRREEFRGRRLQNRTRLNMNKMDKKANRITNNVSVAHAPR